MAKQRNDHPLVRLTAIAQALSDGNRVRILAALRKRELCVCQITELLGLAPSTVSKHLMLLRHAGLVESRKQGRWIHYTRPGRSAEKPISAALQWIDVSLARDARLRADRLRLDEILRIPVEALCRTDG
jgi:DNA-binding transcriptional ArsR family regulator